MDNEEAKDFVLQYLLKMQKKNPKRHTGFAKVQILRDARGKIEEVDESLISLAVDYLYDEGYLKAQSQSGVKFYRLSSKAQDRLLPASGYGTKPQNNIRVFSDGGMIVLGDNYGAVHIDKRVQINNEVEKIAKLIKESNELDEETRVDLLQSALTLQAQVKKPKPDKTILKHAWASLQAASTLSGAGELIKTIAPVIGGLL